jgi:hypothetical protein
MTLGPERLTVYVAFALTVKFCVADVAVDEVMQDALLDIIT